MTQLLLFEACSIPLPLAAGLHRHPAASAAQPAESLQTSSRSGSIPLYDPQQGELHRMGDLARLVLARYDLVAQRRAAMRTRQQTQRFTPARA